MKLVLLHGRNDPAQDMEDWGFNGPVLQNVDYFHNTYNSTITIGFKSNADADMAHGLTGWKLWDDKVLELMFKDDMVAIKPEGGELAFFGDWEIQED